MLPIIGLAGNTMEGNEMRGIDWNLAIAVRNHWQGKTDTGIRLCPLLADLDRLLNYLEETGLRPGHAIDCCPECQDEHRWALLKMLMGFALQMRPASRSRLLMEVDKSLESVRALYGGEKGYREMQDGAETFFDKLDRDRLGR
jgi:hypothetical protein